MKTLYISDLDGTLLTLDARVSPHSYQLLHEAVSDGAQFGIATARTMQTALDCVPADLLSGPAVFMNGALVYDCRLKKVIRLFPMDTPDVEYVFEVLNRYGKQAFVYEMDERIFKIYYNRFDNDTERAFCLTRSNGMKDAFTHCERYPDMQGKSIVYFTVIDDEATCRAMAHEISQRPGLRATIYLDVYSTPSMWFLEIYSSAASKSVGTILAKQYAGADRLVVFGDNLNDLDMFETADYAVAMDNALDEVKGVADMVTVHHEQDAVARFVHADYFKPEETNHEPAR